MDYVRSLGALVLGHRFRRMTERLLEAAEQVYEARGLAVRARWTSTLHLLAGERPLGVTDIASRLQLTHPAIIGIVREMTEAGLVSDVADDADGRRRLVMLTPRARRMLPELRRVWKALAAAQQRRFRVAGCDILAVLDTVDESLASRNLVTEVVKRLDRSAGTTVAASRALVAALGLAVTMAGSAPAQRAELPATPAAERLRSWLDAYNSGDSIVVQRALGRLYSGAALGRRSAAARAAGLAVWFKDYGQMELARVDSSRPHSIVATVRQGGTRNWGQLYLDVDSLAPHHISGIGLIPFVEPPFWSDVVRLATDTELARELSGLADALHARDVFDGVVLVWRNGEPIFARAYGMADRERARPVTMDTPFEMASVSKMFTAVAIVQLIERGELSLDATIASVLPDYPPGASASHVTVRHLLTMSSGIPDLFRSPRYWRRRSELRTLADHWPIFALDSLEFTPGTRWAYSNSNFIILGAIVERVRGVKFAEYIQRNVFVPAGMTRTSYVSSRFAERAFGYTRNRPGQPPGSALDPHRWYRTGGEVADSAAGGPAGGGASTAADLARFGLALVRGRLVSPAMVRDMIAPHIPADYGGADGFGLETRRWNGALSVGHGGAFPGVSNQVEYFPRHGYAVVVLSNTDGAGAQAIANRARALIARYVERRAPGRGEATALDPREDAR